jgi:ligand-binding sensor domain-containing protein/signal transduction histidine kinase
MSALRPHGAKGVDRAILWPFLRIATGSRRQPTFAWLVIAAVVGTMACGCAPSHVARGAAGAIAGVTASGESPAARALHEVASTDYSQSGSNAFSRRAREDSIEFERISLEQGLFQASVSSILQDSKGFMWFGTEEGLTRYDGYEFIVYRHDPDDPRSLRAGSVWELFEDQQGALWIQGEDAILDRYDREANRFVHYPLYDADDPESASSDFIWDLYEDSEGTLWAGTYRSGLYRYDRDADRFDRYRHDPDDPSSLADDRIYALYEDRDGVFWVATKGGLDRFDRETGRSTHYRHNPDDPGSLGSDIVQLIHEDRTGRFWVTTLFVGIEQFDRETGRIVARYEHNPADPQSIDATDRITEIYEDRQGYLWLTHLDGRLDRFDPETGLFQRYRHDSFDRYSLSHNVVSFVTEDQGGNLWVGTAGGLDRFDRETERFIHYRSDPDDPHSLSDNQVTSFYEDRAGVLWIGTNRQGLNLYDPRRAKFEHVQIEAKDVDSADNNNVFAIYVDSAETLWVGTNAGLNRLDRESGTFTHFGHDEEDPYSLSQGRVASIYEDQSGTLWIGTQGGLDKLDRATGRFIHYQEVPEDNLLFSIGLIYSIYEDRSGVMWLGKHREGLCEFDRATGECTVHQYVAGDSLNPYLSLKQVYEDRWGVLWVATEGGLLQFDREKGTFALYERDAADPWSLSSNEIRCIHEDRSGMLWVGTNGGGLNRFDRGSGTFIHYTERDGLPSNIVLGILEDEEGNLWLSTNNGLSRFDPGMEAFRNYDPGDGLQSSKFLLGAYHQSADGEMFFGGVNGLNRFHPEDIKDNAYIPPIALTRLTQGGEDIEVDRALERIEEVVLKWPNNYFEFEFAALSYSRPERNEYAYMLEGFRDEGWNYVGTRGFGRYTNLPGGTYTLKMKGSNHDGVWNEEGLSVKLRIVPPFWATWWFRGMVAMVLVGAVIAFFRLRVRNIEARSRELERLVQERTQTLEQRTDEIEQRRQELEALYRADEQMHRHLQLDQVLQSLVDVAVDILKADKSSVFVRDEERDGWRMVVARGFSPQAMAILSFARGEGLVGRVAAAGEMVMVEDGLTDMRHREERPELAEVLLGEEIRSYMFLPIRIGDAVFGVFNVDFTKPRAFGKDEVRLFMALAQRAALAIENAQLYEQTQELAVVEERNRLARDLHDAVTQTLFSASLIAEALPELWESDQEEGHQLLRELRQLSRGALAEMRTLLLELRPATLTEANLADLLRQLGEAMTGRMGVPVTIAVDRRCVLPPDVHVALYRIAQEALNNVVKHANARHVDVSLRHIPSPSGDGGPGHERIELRVGDNGRGFDLGNIPADRLGLGIIRERAQAIGAVLEIKSQPGEGTQVVVAWEGKA